MDEAVQTISNWSLLMWCLLCSFLTGMITTYINQRIYHWTFGKQSEPETIEQDDINPLDQQHQQQHPHSESNNIDTQQQQQQQQQQLQEQQQQQQEPFAAHVTTNAVQPNQSQANNNNDTNSIPPAPKAIPSATVNVRNNSLVMDSKTQCDQTYRSSFAQDFQLINQVVTHYPDDIARRISIDSSRKPPTSGAVVHVVPPKQRQMNDETESKSSISQREQLRIVIVSFRLPIIVEKQDDGSWHIEFKNELSMIGNLRILQLQQQQKNTHNALNADEYKIVYVGWPGVFCESTEEQESLEDALYALPSFRCYPIFLNETSMELAYDTFCKSILWPSFHYQMVITNGAEFGIKYAASWKSYCDMNQRYAKKACVATENVPSSYIWFHDYHLLMAAQFIKKECYEAKCGLFLHTTFPTSEVFRCLPSRQEILRGMLSNDLLGFHTYDYCRHFLSSCKRILNLNFHTIPINDAHNGYGATLAVHYLGRDVSIRVSHIGIPSDIIQQKVTIFHDELLEKIIKKKYLDLYKLVQIDNRRLIVCRGSNDIIHGTLWNLRAYHTFLNNAHESWREAVCLVQILNKSTYTRSRENLINNRYHHDEPYTQMNGHAFHSHVQRPKSSKKKRKKSAHRNETENAIRAEIECLQKTYGRHCVYLIEDDDMSFNDQIALYSLCDIGLFGTFWEGFNTHPYIFTAAQSNKDVPGALIVSEFMGCHRSLSGVFRINPWDYEEVANTIRTAMVMTSNERRCSHHRRSNHVMTYTFSKWAIGFINDLKTAAKLTASNDKQMVLYGFPSNMRLMYLPINLNKLKSAKATEKLIRSFKRCKKRILLFDYGGTLTDPYYEDNPNCILLTTRNKYQELNEENMAPNRTTRDGHTFDEVIEYLSILAADPMTYVCVVSGATRGELENAFKRFTNRNLLLCSEKGAFWKWPGMNIGEWQKNESLDETDITHWKQIAYDVMKIYCEKCDGSYIQQKSTALVWHYFNSDPEYGNMQAIELERYLKRLLDWYYDVCLQRYAHSRLLEVLPKNIHKGTAAMTILDRIIAQIENERAEHEQGFDEDDLFILSVGNDRSDEKMFESIELAKKILNANDNAFTVSIGLKPTQSDYYLTSQIDIHWLLQTLCSSLNVQTTQLVSDDEEVDEEKKKQSGNDDNDDDHDESGHEDKKRDDGDDDEEDDDDDDDEDFGDSISVAQQTQSRPPESHLIMKHEISQLLKEQQINNMDKSTEQNNSGGNVNNNGNRSINYINNNHNNLLGQQYGLRQRIRSAVVPSNINGVPPHIEIANNMNDNDMDDDMADDSIERVKTPQINHLISPSPYFAHSGTPSMQDNMMFSIPSNNDVD